MGDCDSSRVAAADTSGAPDRLRHLLLPLLLSQMWRLSDCQTGQKATPSLLVY